MLKVIRKVALVVLAIAILVYVSACTYLYLKQTQILFPATQTAPDFQYSFPFPFEEVWIESEGAKLHGLYYPAQVDGQKTASKGLIIFFHGNTEQAQQFGETADVFTTRGWDYFIPDYRGYGKSAGKITSEAQFLADIDRIYEWAHAKYPENQIVFAGRSLGAVPAAYLASKHQARLTVLIAAFYNVAAMKDIRYPYLPDFLLNFRFPNNEWVTKAKSPIYFVHGTEDKTVPFQHTVRLNNLVKGVPHNHYSVYGAGHSDLQKFPIYHEILYTLLRLDDPA